MAVLHRSVATRHGDAARPPLRATRRLDLSAAWRRLELCRPRSLFIRLPPPATGRAWCYRRGSGRTRSSLDHPELADDVDAVIETVAEPDHVEADPIADRMRFYRRNVGPSRWLSVVVSFEQEPGRIITALADRKDPKRWKP